MYKKTLKIIILVLILNFILNYPIFAMTASQLEPIYTRNISPYLKIGGAILGWIRNIAAVSLVVLLAFNGLRFMFGSLEQRAEYKKSLMPLCIGTLIVLGATTITSVVWNISNNCEHVSGICTTDVKCDSCGIQGPIGHRWEIETTSFTQGYGCKYCYKLVVANAYRDDCVAKNEKHEYQIKYYGDYNDIEITCKKCGIVRKSGE